MAVVGRVPGALDDLEAAVRQAGVQRIGALEEPGRAHGPDELEHRDRHRRERVDPDGGVVLRCLELAHDRRRGRGPARPDRVGSEGSELGRGHADRLAHEARQQRIVVAALEVLAERLEQLVARTGRPDPDRRRALVRDDPPDRRRPQLAPSAIRPPSE